MYYYFVDILYDSRCSLFFIFQLYSLNEYKPPISKAKMTQITKSGIKAIKVSMHSLWMRWAVGNKEMVIKVNCCPILMFLCMYNNLVIISKFV